MGFVASAAMYWRAYFPRRWWLVSSCWWRVYNCRTKKTEFGGRRVVS